ncbi:hypothetical protein B0H21DRAFT_826576 [Amylocystis lapponica]|nr:hypothetical protein B0H21DRAFT_826576 [Amylocystis lapponica]
MRSSRSSFTFLFAAVAALVVSVGATPTPTSANGLNPPQVDLKAVPLNAAEPMTNAKRMARGLPPNRPRFQIYGSHLEPRMSDVPNPCPPVTGYIQVGGLGTATYVSRTPNAFGEYGTTTDISAALSVQYTSCDSTSPFDLVALNGIADYPYFGAISGFSDATPNLSASSPNYFYLGGTVHTAPGAPPAIGGNSFTAATGTSESIESAIWTLDSSSGVLTAHWVNPDGSNPASSIMYVASSAAFAVTGSITSFELHFGEAEAVTLTFVVAP